MIFIECIFDCFKQNKMGTATQEEMALTLNGKKNKLKRGDLVESFGHKTLNLPMVLIQKNLKTLESIFPKWVDLIHQSFLSPEQQEDYILLIRERLSRLPG